MSIEDRTVAGRADQDWTVLTICWKLEVVETGKLCTALQRYFESLPATLGVGVGGCWMDAAFGFSESSLWGAQHLGFSRRDSDVVVTMETFDVCGPTGFTCVVLVRSTLQG